MTVDPLSFLFGVVVLVVFLIIVGAVFKSICGGWWK